MRHDSNEMSKCDVPSPKLSFRARTSRVFGVLLYQASKSISFVRLDDFLEVNHRTVAADLELVKFIENIRDAATHSRREVSAGATKHDDDAACHVLTAVIADSLDYSDRAAVSHCEALAHLARDIRFSGCRAVKCSVAGNNGLVANELRHPRMTYDQAPPDRPLPR